ncbi:MAG: SAM-dependent methyltransferase [Ginsengibacter sp.]
MDLTEIIIDRIRAEGPISFHDYMEMALYYPGLGYYTKGSDQFGKSGDYYTSPVLSGIYGNMLGKQIEEMWQLLQKKDFTIVEYGAGAGNLCADILNYLKKNEEIYERLEYVIIEKGDFLASKQKSVLKEKVRWVNDISDVGTFSGCILSNEVLDNFAVHVVEMQDQLMEVFVGFENEFKEILLPARQELVDYFKGQNIELPNGYRTEVNMEAKSWLQSNAAYLQSGFQITIDYGFRAHEYYKPDRSKGTLACYFQHKVSENFYSQAGQQDITAHVNFSSLAEWGKEFGFKVNGYTNQNYFLRSLGVANYLRELEQGSSEENKALLFQVNKLIFEMGSAFKVLIQQKNVEARQLIGMQFSQPI